MRKILIIFFIFSVLQFLQLKMENGKWKIVNFDVFAKEESQEILDNQTNDDNEASLQELLKDPDLEEDEEIKPLPSKIENIKTKAKKTKKSIFKKVKRKSKKQSKVKPKMVETKEEWEQKAVSVPLNERKELTDVYKNELEKEQLKAKKYYTPKPHYTFELYNYPVGSREVDISALKKKLVVHPIIVADKNLQYVAYVNYYYSVDIDQVASNFFVEKLDTTKNKTNRLLEYRHNQQERFPKIKTGFDVQYPRLFNGLSIVDWSSDSKKVLLKERVGSTAGGNYMVYLYVYFLDKNKAYKLETFNNSIVNYFKTYEHLQLNKFRYVIEPLGFSYDNDDLVVAHCYLISSEGKKIFIGTWGYDLKKSETIMISKTNTSVSVSSNGLVLKETLD